MIKIDTVIGGVFGVIGFWFCCYYGNWQTAVGALTIVIGVVKCLR